MFWNNFVTLCNQKGKSPNGACAELGFSANTATKWKQGSVPRDTTLRKIADYFGVTVDELLADPAPSPVNEAMSKLTASMQEALNSMEKEKSPLLRSLENLVKNMTQDQQQEMKKYAEYLISRNENT
jgi:transcriptional regulator with XRE-family HTH domain